MLDRPLVFRLVEIGSVVRIAAVARSDEAGRKTALVWEPLHHHADNADIDDAGTDAAEKTIGEVEAHQALHLCGEHPAQAGERCAERQQKARAEAVDEISLSGRQEGLQHDQQ